MEREKKIYLCCRSLMNVSMDLKKDYEDFSNMILFIADKIAEHEEKREKTKEVYKIHGAGNVHDLSEEKDYTCYDNCKCMDDDKVHEKDLESQEYWEDEDGKAPKISQIITKDDKLIDKEIDAMIEAVRKEVKSVSD